MASIEKRVSTDGVTSYRVKVRKKGYPVETATFNRLTDAKAWAAKIEAAIKEGRHFHMSAAKRHTLAELIERYRAVGLLRLKDGQHRASMLDWWKERLGHATLADLTPACIAEVRDEIASEGRMVWVRDEDGERKRVLKDQPRSGATVNRYLAALSAVCAYGVKELQWLESNPVHRVSKMRESRGNERFLSQEEAALVLEKADQNGRPDFKVFVAILLTTGARTGEILRATWSQVDLERHVIDLSDTKNGERRTLPLVEPALSLLAEHSKVRLLRSSLVFPAPSDPKKPANYRYQWGKLKEACELVGVRFHDMRHTAASFLIMSGAGLRTTADVLGHKTLSMVQRYSHLLDEHKSDAAAKAAALMLTKPTKADDDKTA
ncbi:site-specific integrase [Crenobacter sp. SG2303]|uniref:Site-specific integrase n=1 Tax=Crenobacter oryzisoli TaxID=3056844 RepID=A0ABT7XJQ2_9NEIS|nr:site-specific integrase [Crenobacter sp. SG2303]MDN0074017.1 site-specific integrase [Crenobacter sp. SG2303]